MGDEFKKIVKNVRQARGIIDMVEKKLKDEGKVNDSELEDEIKKLERDVEKLGKLLGKNR